MGLLSRKRPKTINAPPPGNQGEKHQGRRWGWGVGCRQGSHSAQARTVGMRGPVTELFLQTQGSDSPCFGAGNRFKATSSPVRQRLSCVLSLSKISRLVARQKLFGKIRKHTINSYSTACSFLRKLICAWWQDVRLGGWQSHLEGLLQCRVMGPTTSSA